MSMWVAVSYGALDVSDRTDFSGAEVLVTPTLPGTPLALPRHAAALWRKLVRGPVDAGELSSREREITEQMQEAGLCTTDIDHPARQRTVPAPWLTSPLHELVYGLMTSVAREAGIPIVFIKGPVLHAQGLRTREHSGDVDVWCEPERLPELLAAIRPWGWRLLPDVWEHTLVNHSTTLVPETGWGCEIDLHRRFPGMALEDSAAFNALRVNTVPVSFAGVDAFAPTRPANAVLSALHHMRPRMGREVEASAEAASVEILRIAGPEVIEAATELDALVALRPQLLSAFPDTSLDISAAGRPRDWYPRGQPNKALKYWASLREVGLLHRPGLLLKLIWPSADVALASSNSLGIAETSPVRARLRRLHRGFRDVLRSSRKRRARR